MFFLFAVLFLASCAQAPLIRGPASFNENVKYGDFDPLTSSVKIFPAEVSASQSRHYLYMVLKNGSGEYVDCEAREVKLRQKNGKEVPFKLERMLRGRYYLILERQTLHEEIKLNLFVRNKQLKKNMRLFLRKADRNKSVIKQVGLERDGIKFQIILKDQRGRPVKLSAAPEIILAGLGTVENLVLIGHGKWQFDLTFPNVNQVIYISIRANGTYLADMYRIQHIEK